MTCQNINELIQRELDGDLNRKEKLMLDEHLLTCDDCKQLFATMQELSNQLTEMPKVNPPYSIVDQLMPQLEALRADNNSSDESKGTSVVKKWRFNRLAKVVSSAAAAVLVVTLAWSQLPFSPSTTQNDMAMNVAESGGIVTMSSGDHLAQDDEAGAESFVMEDQMGSSAKAMPEVAADDGDMANRQSDSSQSSQSVQDVEGIEGVSDADVRMTAERTSDQFVTTEPPLHDSSQYEVNGLSVDAARLSSGKQYPSPDEAYVAIVISEEQLHQLVIINQQGEEVYASRQFPADEVSHVEWASDSKHVRYETVVGEAVALSTISVE